jgi:hypothetical protein
MNIEKITRIYREFVRRLPEPGMPDLEPNAGPQILTGPVLIRGNLILREEAALAYFETLEKLHALISAEGTWNNDAVDDLLAKYVLGIASAPPEKRQVVLTERREGGQRPLRVKVEDSSYGRDGSVARRSGIDSVLHFERPDCRLNLQAVRPDDQC